ncbi:hypothetical protein DFH09DRAFT_1096004 [Mycena vulgaris]|nr:hypothetical protein DFH09DRAFT_1096004 [Mycena vulgaris]
MAESVAAVRGDRQRHGESTLSMVVAPEGRRHRREKGLQRARPMRELLRAVLPVMYEDAPASMVVRGGGGATQRARLRWSGRGACMREVVYILFARGRSRYPTREHRDRRYGRGGQEGDAGGVWDEERLPQMLGTLMVVRVVLGYGEVRASCTWAEIRRQMVGGCEEARNAAATIARDSGSVVSSVCGPYCDEGCRLMRRGGKGGADDARRWPHVLHMGEVLRVIMRSVACAGVERWGDTRRGGVGRCESTQEPLWRARDDGNAWWGPTLSISGNVNGDNSIEKPRLRTETPLIRKPADY